MSEDGIRLVDVAGAGPRRGEAHGEQLRSEIAEALESWRDTLAARTDRVPREYVRDFLAATSHVAAIAEHSPDLAAEVDGIARGSGQDRDEILAYNFMDEEWRHRADAVEACSLLGTTTTADGAVLLGQNMDLPMAMRGSQVVLRIAGHRGDPEQIVVTAAGLVALLGVNRLGVATCVNTLNRLPWSRSGVPVAFVIREILRRPDAEAAGRYLVSIPHASGQHYAVADRSGVRGFECSAAGATPGPVGEPRLIHTNHELWDPTGLALSADVVPSTTRARYAAIEASADGVARSADLERLFSEDTDLCIVPQAPKLAETFASAVFRLTEPPTVRVSLGRPDTTPWRSVDWADPDPDPDSERDPDADLRGTGVFLGGEWREARSGATSDVVDPATGATLRAVADAGAEDARAALEIAAAAQAPWAATAPRIRAGILRAAATTLRRDRDDVAGLITAEMGKPLRQSLDEVEYAAGFLDWFAEEAVRIAGTHAASPDGRGSILTVREPVGPCLLVTPWNFPLAMGARKIGPALAAGCTIVFKPAPQTPLSALALARILRGAGLPDGVLSVLPTTRAAEIVGPLLADGRIRKVSFTGSTATGRILLAQSADRVLRTSMELGGNAPFLVFEDADLDLAVDAAVVAKLRNGGEACTAANRFLVHASVADEFVERLVARFAAMPVGPGTDPGVEIGPLIDEAARAKVERLVADAVARGAVVRTGGSRIDRPGFFYPPTVLTGVPADAEILATEIFGPVAPVRTFTAEADAIREANDTDAGLVAYVITRDLDRAMRVAASLRTGMVGINTGVVSDVAAPFGGVKQSGLGREGGHLGIDEYLDHKYLAIRAPRGAA
jgi:succinate-semialdehyde dehydrogenase/glutarate-semialdehyde dehydrogenase